jgi:hypothetical protein
MFDLLMYDLSTYFFFSVNEEINWIFYFYPLHYNGDKDLRVLHPFRGISILTAADFLNNF